MDSRTTPSYGTPNNPQNQGHASGYPPPYPVDGIQNNAPTAPYPPMEAYPPVSTAYPPMSTAYPPPMSTAYPPPTTAPPPYSDAIPNYPTTNVTNTTIVLISQPDPYIPEVGFNSKTIRLGKFILNSLWSNDILCRELFGYLNSKNSKFETSNVFDH